MQLNNCTLYDDNALGLSRRGTSSANLCTIVQPARMTALNPDSVRRPPGVATRTPTVDTALHGNKNIIANSPLHPGANWTGRPKAGAAAPKPNTRARKRESQARLLLTDTNKKTRQTFSAQTRYTPLGRRVTSQLDMKVTPQRRTYMWSLLQKSCYVERHSVKGGATPIHNPLALIYHFGQASATPDRKRAAEITEHPPHPPGRNHVVNEEGAEISEASSRDGRDAHSREQEGDLRKPGARLTPSRREGRGSADIFFFEKPPNLWKPWRFFRKRRRKQ